MSTSEFVPQLEKERLPCHLAVHVLLDESELLDALDLDAVAALDRDVDVLADRPDAPAYLPSSPKEGSDLFGDLPGLRARNDLGTRGDLDERDSQAVEPVGHLAGRLPDLSRGVLLEADRGNRVPPSTNLELSVHGDERGPLEAGGVRPVDHDLSHHLDLVDRAGSQEEGQRQGRVEGRLVQGVGRFLVHLHEAGGRAAFVPVDQAARGLEGRGHIDRTALASRRP